VIDVGANRGQFALFALHRFPRAMVHAFEPLPAAVAVFRRVTEPSARVTLSAVALGAAPGRLTMHVTNEDDASSALPLTPEASARLGLHEVARVEVPVTALDLAFPAPPSRPCLLKLDVQGGELEVLRGAERLLASVDEVLTEVSFVPLYVGQPLADDVIAFLAERGFVAVAGGDRRDAAQADVLLRRREG
jgi:FkbM family methyltransferase